MIKKITREEEAAFPHFNSHIEARTWFKEKYGGAFELVSVEGKGDSRCYRNTHTRQPSRPSGF